MLQFSILLFRRQTVHVYVSFSVTSITLSLTHTAVERNMRHNLLEFGLKIFFRVKLPKVLEDKRFNSTVFFPVLQGIYNAVFACRIQTRIDTGRLKCVENRAAIFSLFKRLVMGEFSAGSSSRDSECMLYLFIFLAEANQDEVGVPGKINWWGPSKILFC